MKKNTNPQSELEFWQFCEIAQCLPNAPDMNLSKTHKNFHKHPHRHELRALWVVDRAKTLAMADLNLDLVIAASKREEETHRNASKTVITTFNFKL